MGRSRVGGSVPKAAHDGASRRLLTSASGAYRAPSRLPLLVIEDEILLVTQLRCALEVECEPVFVDSKREARRLIPSRPWRGIMVDVGLTDGDGTRLLPLIREHHPEIPVIVMTGAENAALSHAAFRQRARFLTKPLPLGWLRVLIDEMLGVGAPRSLRLTLEVLGLTPAEVLVVTRLASGATAAETAAALSVSPTTIRTQCASVYRRLGVNSLVEALSVAAGWRARG